MDRIEMKLRQEILINQSLADDYLEVVEENKKLLDAYIKNK